MKPNKGTLPKYNLYLSRTWNYNNAVAELDELLAVDEDFRYVKHFVPENDGRSRQGNERELYDLIKNRMKFSHVVLLMCGVYSSYSRWVNKEIIACKHELNKPLIAIQRFEAGRTSAIITENADVIVDWEPDPIIQAIKRLTTT